MTRNVATLGILALCTGRGGRQRNAAQGYRMTGLTAAIGVLALCAGCRSAVSPSQTPQKAPEQNLAGGQAPAKQDKQGQDSPGESKAPSPQAPAPPVWESWDLGQSRSVGSVLEGKLQGGVQLPERAPGLLHNPNKDRARAFGTAPVVRTVIHAGAVLAKRPVAEHLLVNDLSFEKGGPITGHASHRSGRDVDFYFPFRGPKGAPFPGKLIPIDPEGIGFDYRDLQDPRDDIKVQVDLERLWSVLAAMLQSPYAKVQMIYVVAHLQEALAQHARAIGEPQSLVARFLSHSCQPGKAPHDDHIHVRFYCSVDDVRAGCEDTAPVHPDQRASLANAGLKPKIARPASRAARKVKTTSPKQARAKAGPLHPSVADFLDRRKTWTRNIPPGPARCR